MQLTSDQQKALDAIGEWMKDDDQWMFYLGGYAGTGKTTLMQTFINSLDKKPTCLAPTGKAASVLGKRLDGAAVTTIHSALYKPVMPDVTKLEALELRLQSQPGSAALLEEIRAEKRRLAEWKLKFVQNDGHAIIPGELVVVDESSMVNNRMMDDLERTGAKVLFVGDPGQLPPVNDAGYFTYTRPDAMLQQVMRQALDNPIVGLSMAIRNGRRIDRTDGEHVQFRDRSAFDIAELAQYDQMLTGQNKIRRKLNRIARKQRGIEDHIMPVAGEKLICLKNAHKFDNYFINGVQCASTSNAEVNRYGDWCVDLLYEGEAISQAPFYHYPFEVHYRPNEAEEDPWAARSKLLELDYGYAITVHKSQGSEWGKVALVDDYLMANDREFRKRWLYTAVTRAKEKLIWIDMGE